MDKKQLRTYIKNKRQALSGLTYEAMSLPCFNHLIDLLSNKTFHKIGIYIDVRNEVSTRKMIEYLWQKGKEVYIPKCEKDGIMNFYRIQCWQDVKVGMYGILEPIHLSNPMNCLDVMITPLVAFNEHGYRLGVGGGYYDRFYEQYPMCYIGLAFSFQKCQFIQEKHDLQFDYVVLENEIIKFK